MVFAKNVELVATIVGVNGELFGAKKELNDVAIKFYHDTKGGEKNRGRFTRCELIAVPTGSVLTRENGEIIGVGETKVFSGNFFMKADPFDRRIGRKEALERALEDSGLDKNARAVIWAAYRAKCKMPDKGKMV